MSLITTIFTLMFFFTLAMSTFAFITGKKTCPNREKFTPLGCGFDPNKKARALFSLRLLLITILFLIFDVELSLLLPLGLLVKFSEPLHIVLTASFITFILITGLLHDWKQGDLAWVI